MMVLITGAYGFIGRHVALHFAKQGYFVTAVGHSSWSRDEQRKWGIETWHSVDVTPDTLATYAGGPDVIIHCAGSSAVAYSMSHPRQDFERSVLTSMAVLDFQRIYAPAARLVILSSAAVYGVVETMPISVATRRNPISPYGVHKKIVEDLAEFYSRYFRLNVSIIRLFSIFGIGLRKQLLWDACEKFARGVTEFSGTGEETRDWLHVDDAARLIAAVAQRAAPACPIFNGGTRIATTRALLELLARQFNLVPQFSGAVRPGDPQHYQADMSSTVDLGWRPSRDLDAEVAAYADWYVKGAL